MQPLVSIIIPLYNAENHISETINSALNQSYKNIEIIVVDDGSTDNSSKKVQEYKQKNITLVHQKNKGASAARNHGLSLAQGDYIQYLDADDILHPQKIEHQFNTIQQYSAAHLVGCQWKYFIEDITKPFKTMPFDVAGTTHYDKVNWLMDRPYMIPHTWLVSRKLIDSSGLWNECLTLNDDGEYFYRVIAASDGIVMDHNALAYYRAGNPNSLSTRRTKEAMTSWLNSIKCYKQVMYSLAGNQANHVVDKSLFEVAYHCLNLFPDLVELSKAEMYHPEINHNLHDNLVYNLSKLIGLSKAKKTRENVNYIRNTAIVNSLFVIAKKLVGKEVY